MKKLDLILIISAFVVALAGIVLIIINILSEGSPTLIIALSCVVLSQILIMWSHLRRRKPMK